MPMVAAVAIAKPPATNPTGPGIFERIPAKPEPAPSEVTNGETNLVRVPTYSRGYW